MTNAGRLQGGDAQPTESAESDWSDQIANAGDTPIGELVDGLHEVAALPIAYARLPRRAHTAYAEDFTCWGDIAGQTIESLLSRPKIGERAVQAMLAAAKDAVAGYQAAAVADRPHRGPRRRTIRHDDLPHHRTGRRSRSRANRRHGPPDVVFARLAGQSGSLISSILAVHRPRVDPAVIQLLDLLTSPRSGQRNQRAATKVTKRQIH